MLEEMKQKWIDIKIILKDNKKEIKEMKEMKEIKKKDIKPETMMILLTT